MARTSTYSNDSNYSIADRVVGLDSSGANDNVTFNLGSLGNFFRNNLQIPTASFADDAAAATGGIPVGGIYHTSGTLKVRLA